MVYKHTFTALFCACLVCMLCAVAAPRAATAADALDQLGVVSCPPVKLQHWKHSTNDEKLAFLFGFVTAIEMEREWQDKAPLPIEKSTVGGWARGLDGVTLGQMSRTVDNYIAEHPEETDKSVLEVLGATYVRPKMAPAERKRASARYAEILKNR